MHTANDFVTTPPAPRPRVTVLRPGEPRVPMAGRVVVAFARMSATRMAPSGAAGSR